MSEADSDGVAYVVAAGDLAMIVNPYRLVYLLTRQGWNLLEGRSGLQAAAVARDQHRRDDPARRRRDRYVGAVSEASKA